MGPAGAYIAVSAAAVEAGGPALLATLVVVSSLLPLTLAMKLPALQRLLTPTVSATVLMLIPVTVMPSVFSLLAEAPPGTHELAVPLSALAALAVIVGVALTSTGALRLWAPILGVAAGTAIAAGFGLYDAKMILEARWLGFPTGEWEGLDLQFDPDFWALLPAFLLVAVIASIRTISGAIAIQRVSWRRRRAVDFRAVQGAVTVDGLGNFLAGLAGTAPNASTTVGASVTELTGVAARGVGIAAGAIFVAAAFMPKLLAVVLAIPGPVVATYLGVLVAMIFIVGMRIAFNDGIDYRKGMIIGISFWIGIGFQYDLILAEQVSGIAGGLLKSGITTGGVAAILMTLVVELSSPRRSRLETESDISALPTFTDFLDSFTVRSGWNAAMAQRLAAVCEETLLILKRQENDSGAGSRNLRLIAQKDGNAAVLEFIVSAQTENIENRLALFGEIPDDGAVEQEVSLRLLRHLASSVRHQQFHGIDILTVRVAAPDFSASGGK